MPQIPRPMRMRALPASCHKEHEGVDFDMRLQRSRGVPSAITIPIQTLITENESGRPTVEPTAIPLLTGSGNGKAFTGRSLMRSRR